MEIATERKKENAAEKSQWHPHYPLQGFTRSLYISVSLVDNFLQPLPSFVTTKKNCGLTKETCFPVEIGNTDAHNVTFETEQSDLSL